MRAVSSKDRLSGPVVALGIAAALALTACQSPEESPDRDQDWTVSRVIDGDTIVVAQADQEQHVRLLGIDAPEVGRRGRPSERCADEATALTQELTASKSVELIPDDAQPTTDRYGRTLAYVEADGRDVSAELLRAGLAEPFYSARDIARYDEYEKLAAQAASARCR